MWKNPKEDKFSTPSQTKTKQKSNIYIIYLVYTFN